MSSKVSLYYYQSNVSDAYIHIYYEMYDGRYYCAGKNPKTGRVIERHRIPHWLARLLTRICFRYIGDPQ